MHVLIKCTAAINVAAEWINIDLLFIDLQYALRNKVETSLASFLSEYHLWTTNEGKVNKGAKFFLSETETLTKSHVTRYFVCNLLL